jgi:hypothetical protein
MHFPIFCFAALLLNVFAQVGSEDWEVFSEESNLFCGNHDERIGSPSWNGLGFQDTLELCAQACKNSEGCKFAAFRTDSGRGQCNGWVERCNLRVLEWNADDRKFIVVRMIDDAISSTEDPITTTTTATPTSIPTANPTLTPTVNPTANPTLTPTTSGHEELKVMVKTAFDRVKITDQFRTSFVLPALIRKAFHDAGHFDQNSGEMRMGCIQHFLTGGAACPQHAHLEEADSFVDAVMNLVNNVIDSIDTVVTHLSSADAVQLLGALAVDELAQGTNAPTLYERIRTGRTDPQADTCLDGVEMCENLPAFFTRIHQINNHVDIVDSLNDVWEKEIEGKMIGVNSFSKRDAVALIGAHTVGSVREFGAWVAQPMIFDNEYFLQLKRVKDWLDNEGQFGRNQGHPFGFSIRPNWFQDSERVEDPNGPFPGELIMMLDSDLALVTNAPELVEEYAADMMKWRADFNDAYVRMSELGVNDELEPRLSGNPLRRLLSRAEEELDEDYEFFQNLQILRERQAMTAHTALKKY